MAKQQGTQFFRLTQDYAEKLIHARLTATEWKIWAFLSSHNPWADKYKNLDTQRIMAIIGCSKASWFRAKARLQELGVFDFIEVGGIRYRHIPNPEIETYSQQASLKNEIPSLKNETQEGVASLKNETPSLKNETAGNLDLIQGTSSLTLKTNKTDQKDCIEGVTEKIGRSCSQEESSDSSPSIRQPKYDSRLGVRPPLKDQGSVPPRSPARYRQEAGPWIDSTTGRFNPEFVRHTAALWKKSKGAGFADMTDQDVAALVISHFLQKPELIAAKWQAFCEGAYQHAQSTDARLRAGINISEKEQKELVAKAPAIAYGAQLAAEDKLLPEPPAPAPLPFAPAQSLPPTPSSLLPPSTPAPAPLPPSTPALEPIELTPEQMAANVARLAEITKQVGESRSMNFKRK